MEGSKTILPEGVKDLQRIWKTASCGEKPLTAKCAKSVRKGRKGNETPFRGKGNQSDFWEQLTN
jgi:hypothetical protein